MALFIFSGTSGKPVSKTHLSAHDPDACVAMLVSGGLEHAGGIGRWAGYLQESWSRQGLRPRLEILDTRGHGHAGIAAIAFTRALFRLVELRARGQLGLIHANISLRGSTLRKWIVSGLARCIGVPMLLHLHGGGYDAFYRRCPGWVRGRISRLFARSPLVIVLSRGWADWVASELGVAADRIQVLHNGVARPDLASDAAAAAGSCHIVFLGRLGRRKGVPELLEALGSTAMRQRAWEATLAGDGDVDEYAQQVGRQGLAQRVRLPGWVDQGAASALMTTADILVLPSYEEAFPMSVIEALAHGVAVVTTPVGATPELIADGHSALFVPPGDARALRDALIRLIDDPTLRRAIGAAGQAVFRARLDIDVLARELAASYRRVGRQQLSAGEG